MVLVKEVNRSFTEYCGSKLWLVIEAVALQGRFGRLLFLGCHGGAGSDDDDSAKNRGRAKTMAKIRVEKARL